MVMMINIYVIITITEIFRVDRPLWPLPIYVKKV
jgi:hypothetical protein